MKKTVSAVVGVLLFIAGFTVAATPRHELVYNAHMLPPICGESGCVGAYFAQVGSTGSEPEHGVRVELKLEHTQDPGLPIQVRNAGKSPVPFTERAEDGGRTIEIGTIAAGEWREISFQRLYRPDQPPIPANEMVIAAASDAAQGKWGSPQGTRFIRAMTNIASLVY